MDIQNNIIKRQYKKSSSFLRTYAILLLNFSCFYGYVLGNDYFLLSTVSISLIFLWFAKERIVSFRRSDLLFLLIFIVFLISASNSFNGIEALKYAMGVGQLIIIMMILKSNYSWGNQFIKIALYFSGSHVLFSLLYFFLPNYIRNLRIILLKPEAFGITEKLYQNGLIAGIAPQTGNNAYYISIFIGICLIFLLQFIFEKKIINTLLYMFLLVMGITMLLATGKRGPLFAVFLAMTIVFIIYSKKTRFISKSFFKILIVASISFLILINTDSFNSITNLMANKENADFFSGRSILWEETLSFFMEYPFFGQGLLTMRVNIGLDSHNVYFQLLAETGLLGFLLGMLFFISNLIITIRRINVDTVGLQYYMSLFFQTYFLVYCFTGNPIYNLNLFLIYIVFVSIR